MKLSLHFEFTYAGFSLRANYRRLRLTEKDAFMKHTIVVYIAQLYMRE